MFGNCPLGFVIRGYTADRVGWTSSDVRFTRMGNPVYAFQMAWPDDSRAVIRSLVGHEVVTGVLLGRGRVALTQLTSNRRRIMSHHRSDNRDHNDAT